MPTYLRNWYLQKLVDTKDKEQEAQDRAMKKSKGPNVHRPSSAGPRR